ncbi:hypothetical protein [Streptomyces yaizuensis]|uniref:Lipoprotein n=1 Tax=Streptomyces yaizuensis TaxID=2989713 RepID=A0ABQ5P4N8_9ACTN|nr:hypothetical protein [Streptomyces sp. YSPA8]GLF97561.1 hypothetical protein SYYSPA8_24710 [Streptomyces sp. YSPA8]
MKTKQWLVALPLALALASITGCGMDDFGKSGVPSAGRSSIDDATTATKQVSSEILDLVGVKGDATEPGPRVSECGGDRDRETYYQMRHPWSLVPAPGQRLDGVMERLRDELPKHGWKIVQFERDNSRNQNFRLTADHDDRKFSVRVVHLAKNEPPQLSITIVSGCYQVLDGQRVDRY